MPKPYARPRKNPPKVPPGLRVMNKGRHKITAPLLRWQVRDLMYLHNVSKIMLANATGLDRSDLSKWLNGKRNTNVTVEYVMRIVLFFQGIGVDIHFGLFEVDPESDSSSPRSQFTSGTLRPYEMTAHTNREKKMSMPTSFRPSDDFTF